MISDKQPNWKKEFYWKSLLKQIQDELPVKDVAQDPELKDNFTIHSVQRTQCGVFIIGLFQRGISLEFSYRSYKESNSKLYKTFDKQDLFDSKTTHCLLLN